MSILIKPIPNVGQEEVEEELLELQGQEGVEEVPVSPLVVGEEEVQHYTSMESRLAAKAGTEELAATEVETLLAGLLFVMSLLPVHW